MEKLYVVNILVNLDDFDESTATIAFGTTEAEAVTKAEEAIRTKYPDAKDSEVTNSFFIPDEYIIEAYENLQLK